jgi:hypothetical protein
MLNILKTKIDIRKTSPCNHYSIIKNPINENINTIGSFGNALKINF